jgi:hypothetical protein
MRANPPHKGIVTHHHDQSMTWQSFRTINAIPNKVKPLNPLDVDDSFDILLILNLFYFKLRLINSVNKSFSALISSSRVGSFFSVGFAL